MQVQALDDRFGVGISGLGPLDTIGDTALADILELLYRQAVVCIRDQDIKAAQLADFGSRLGEPTRHNEVNLRLDGLETVMSLSNADERDDRQLNGGAHWHTDLIHTEEPASFTMLHAVAVPKKGGRTLFANQGLAYEQLPPGLAKKIEDLVVIHCYEGRTDGSYPEIHHPLIRKHPVSGRAVIYGAADTGIGIVGMDVKEAMALYEEIGAYATRDSFVYRHAYQHNDVVIWDNAQLLHAAEVLERAKRSDEKRIMHRVSVRGWPLP